MYLRGCTEPRLRISPCLKLEPHHLIIWLYCMSRWPGKQQQQPPTQWNHLHKWHHCLTWTQYSSDTPPPFLVMRINPICGRFCMTCVLSFQWSEVTKPDGIVVSEMVWKHDGIQWNMKYRKYNNNQRPYKSHMGGEGGQYTPMLPTDKLIPAPFNLPLDQQDGCIYSNRRPDKKIRRLSRRHWWNILDMKEVI